VRFLPDAPFWGRAGDRLAGGKALFPANPGAGQPLERRRQAAGLERNGVRRKTDDCPEGQNDQAGEENKGPAHGRIIIVIARPIWVATMAERVRHSGQKVFFLNGCP
jgi:hypothetical protein